MSGAAALGIIGLGVMGQGLAQNFASSGVSVLCYDSDPSKGVGVPIARSVADLVERLERPRKLILLVPAGTSVDAAIAALSPHISPGDLLVDAGNSYFRDTDARGAALAQNGIDFIGMGLSGGKTGARFGPSLMPGGARAAFSKISSLLESISAQAYGEACVRYMGRGGAGHFVKMVHNGIEYGLMQLLAETYHVLSQVAGLNSNELHRVYAAWNELEVKSYLVEISAAIFAKSDPLTGGDLIDFVSDVAQGKGTGTWTSQTALSLGVPIPTIDAAVALRNLSRLRDERKIVSNALPALDRPSRIGRDELVDGVRKAYHLASAITYAQGFSLIAAASVVLNFGTSLEDVARVWRGGCIIRAAMLDDIVATYGDSRHTGDLMASSFLAKLAREHHTSLRSIAATAIASGIPVPAFAASLSYFDAYRSTKLPLNLVQAQRDCFGAHTYERTDRSGAFHTEWLS